MQTQIAERFRNTAQGRVADAILRSCVHCGFCLATCPTYQLLGDELDSPRGRIYLIKQLLEGHAVTEKTRTHLDRCLTCRSCETTCPSGVQYGRLLDIGRDLTEKHAGRAFRDALQRRALRTVLANPALFGPLLKLGRLIRPLLPAGLRNKIPPSRPAPNWPSTSHARRMLVLEGCVQTALAPSINVSAARVLDRLGISLIRARNAGCCGALSYHINAQDEGLDYMRRNINAWWPHLQNGIEAIVMTASGCGVMVKEYGHLLAADPQYAEKAVRISALTKDIVEILHAEQEALSRLFKPAAVRGIRIAFHSPCTLQHGQKLTGAVEPILSAAGYELCPVPEAHLCCGSAGTYSILQPGLSQQLLTNKIQALESGAPQQIVSGNIGCLVHLQSGTSKRVRHWIELIEDALP
ncbi:MAG: glycolate oxidase subunit GlcF [Burkholderiales bacterium]